MAWVVHFLAWKPCCCLCRIELFSQIIILLFIHSFIKTLQKTGKTEIGLKVLLLLLLLLLFGVSCARPRESENTLSVQRPQPQTTNPCKEEKDKIVGVKIETADHGNRKALALLLKTARPTPSNKGSLRSFQRDTERFCDTEKSTNEEAWTSAYEQPKHHE